MRTHEAALMIPIFALLIPMVIVPVALIARYLHRRREWQHRERMKALEMGIPLYPAHAWPSAFVATAIGAGVPLGTFFFTWMMALTTHYHRDELVIAPTLVGLAGVIAGYKLGTRLLGVSQKTVPEARISHHGKPYANDPDAYDVAGRRG